MIKRLVVHNIKHISYYATNLILIVMFASWPVYASANFKNEPDTLICSFATATKNGEKVWSTYQKMYVKEAKKRGLSCGIGSKGSASFSLSPLVKIVESVASIPLSILKPTVVDNSACSLNNLNVCSDGLVCQLGSRYINGKSIWDERSQYVQYSVEAKKRGLSCGVGSSSSTSISKSYTNKFICDKAAPRSSTERKWLTTSSPFYKYVVEAKKRGLSCGVKTISSTTKTSSVCSLNNLNVCSNALVCQRGSRLIDGKRLWDERSQYIKYLVEAKKRGLSCGVESSSSYVSKSYTNKFICDKAAPRSSTERKWLTTSSPFYKYVVEAKKRGLSCGVGSSISTTKTTSACSSDNLNVCSDALVCGQGSRYINGKRIWDERSQHIKYSVEAKKRGLSCGTTSTSAEPKSVSNLPNCPSSRNVRWHNCFGTYTRNGHIRAGVFKNNKMNGKGAITFENGSTFIGRFMDGQRHGQGTFTSADGSTFVGEHKYDDWFKGTLTVSGGGSSFTGTWKEGKLNGQGTQIYGANSEIEGTKYVGEFKDMQKHGQGTIIWSSGRILEGIWKDDLLQDAKISTGVSNLPDCPKNVWHNCFGTETWADGSKYAGEWKENNKNGLGTMIFASGAKYVGDWKNNKRTGQGIYTSVDGSIYKGGYKNNKWNGQGTFIYGPKTKRAGETYVGSWKNDKRNGQGTKTFANSDKYVGEFKDDNRNGQGTYTWKSGNTYVGEFKDNKNSGQGVFTYKSGDKYVGEFKDSSFYGQGTFTYKSGRVDKGTWKDDKLNGQATVTYINGDMFVGEFTDDKRTKGTYTYGPQSDWAGDKYVGGWRDGKRHGQGTYTFADGTVRNGTWKDGEFEYAKTPTKPVPVVKAPTQDDQAIPASSGSGFAVSSDGYVMTNSHVIDGCQDVFIHTPEKDVKMRVISNDPKNDLALLKGNFTPLAVFSLSSKRPEITQDIFVAGYPFGYRVSSSVKVTKGIISSLTGIGNDFSNFQMDAALQSGNSGGPVLDDMGNVVGVAVAKLDAMKMLKDTGSIPENTNFGIKANVVKSVLDSNNVDVPSENKSVISTSQRAKLITDGTYYISCWMTLAQIEKVRSKKVLFSDFD